MRLNNPETRFNFYNLSGLWSDDHHSCYDLQCLVFFFLLRGLSWNHETSSLSLTSSPYLTPLLSATREFANSCTSTAPQIHIIFLSSMFEAAPTSTAYFVPRMIEESAASRTVDCTIRFLLWVLEVLLLTVLPRMTGPSVFLVWTDWSTELLCRWACQVFFPA
jgi:hypothetical protein